MNILHTLPLPRSTWRLAALLALLLAMLTISPTLVSANSPPQAPSSVTVTRADGTLTATWPAVADAVGYHVTYTSDGGSSWTAAAINHPNTTITFIVKNSATYVVAVRARTPRGYSAWRNSAPSGPFVSPLPDPPSGLKASPRSGEITLTWNNPSDATIIRYEYQYRQDPPGAGWSAWTAVPNSTRVTTSFTKTGLTNGNEYRFKLRAVNADGAGNPAPQRPPYYVAATPSDGAHVPKPPGTPPPATPASVTVTRSAGMLSASWPGDDLAISYHVTYSSDGGASWTLAALNHPKPAIVITNVSDSAAYVVAVRARNDTGYSGWTNSAPIAPITPAITFTNVTATTATLNLANHNSAWYYKRANTTIDTCSGVISAGTNSANITGLKKSTSYTYGAYSDSGCSNVLATAPLTTLTPSLAAVSNVGTSTLTLTLSGWNYVLDGHWSYTHSGQNAGCTYVGPSLTANVTGLTAGTFYSFSAHTHNSCSQSSLIATTNLSYTDVSVGNLGEPVSSSVLIGYSSDNFRAAVAFTTGDHSDGYILSDVTAKFSNKTGSPSSIVVAIHAADTSNGSNPDTTSLTTLSGSNPDTDGLYTYTCSTSCSLSAATTYFVVMSTPDTSAPKWYTLWTTSSDDEDKQPINNGWSIANVGRYKQGSNAWADFTTSQTPMLHITANVDTQQISPNMNATLSRGD